MALLLLSSSRGEFQARFRQQSAQNSGGIEIALRQGAGGTGVPRVVASDRFDAGQRLIDAAERQQSFTGWKKRAEARLLRQHRAAGCQVTGAAIAEPPPARRDVAALGDAELGPGALYESP